MAAKVKTTKEKVRKEVKKQVKKQVSSMKKIVKKEQKRNVRQNVEIAKLRLEMDKLKKKKVKIGHISEYNFFIKKQILSGLTFSQAVKQWNKYKSLQSKNKRRPSAYNQFIGSQMRLGKTWTQAVALWKLAKSGKLGRKGSTKTVTKYKTRTIKSKPKIRYRTRTITSKPKIRYRTKTKTVVKRIKSKPTIKYRTRTIKSKPKVITKIRYRGKKAPVVRTVTRTVRAAPSFNAASLRELVASTVSSSSVSKKEMHEALAADDEEIAFKIVQTYFKEIARFGFKKQLTLDEIVNAYLYALARVKREDVELSEVAQAVKKAGIRK